MTMYQKGDLVMTNKPAVPDAEETTKKTALELYIMLLERDVIHRREGLKHLAENIHGKMERILQNLNKPFDPDHPEFFSEAGELQALGPRLDSAGATFRMVSKHLQDIRHILKAAKEAK